MLELPTISPKSLCHTHEFINSQADYGYFSGPGKGYKSARFWE